MDYNKHQSVVEALGQSQEAELDNRERSREAHEFLDARNGQWETSWWESADGRPRYTFDLTSPIVDQICDDLEQMDFSVDVKPAGGGASKADAKLLDGMVRNIEAISDASTTYNIEARNMVTGGWGAWLIKTDYATPDSFDQDLMICHIANAVDSVWPGPFKKPDGSDMQHCFVLEAVPKAEYRKKYKDRSGQGLSQGKWANAFYYKRDHVIVGQVYYIVKEPRELLLLSDGRVVENNEEYKKVADELAMAGVTVSDRRNHPKSVCMTRLFDAEGWIGKAQRTVFNQVPVILDIGNIKFYENKLLYRGAVEKLIDPQRVFNYAKSREIEEGALAPRAKKWMTYEQIAGHEDSISTMNVNADPVQIYNHVEGQPPPFDTGGAQVNPGLSKTSEDMKTVIRDVGGLHAANLGDNPNLQSGVAIKSLQAKGDVGSHKYIQAHERAIARTGRILVDAIPKVYDTRRQVRILKEDGSFDMTTLNDNVFDQQTQEWVTVNDVTKGKYDVTCTAGPSFDNRQEETVAAMTELGQVLPEAMQMGSDILLNSITSPGMDLLSARMRQMLFQQGMIPFEQMTDEEKMLFQQQQQQPPPPDPNMLLAQAEAEKAQADKEHNQVKLAIAQRETELKAMELQLKQGDQQLRQLETQIKAARESAENEAQLIENQIARQKFNLEARETVAETNKTVAETAKTIKETALMGTGNG